MPQKPPTVFIAFVDYTDEEYGGVYRLFIAAASSFAAAADQIETVRIAYREPEDHSLDDALQRTIWSEESGRDYKPIFWEKFDPELHYELLGNITFPGPYSIEEVPLYPIEPEDIHRE